MDMANLPEPRKSSAILETEARFKDVIVEQLSKGNRPYQIARKLYPKDRLKRRKLEHRIWWLAQHDQDFALRVGLRAKGELLLALPGTATAVGQRAQRGRMDAARVVMEATGFHNPKVKHEHSGEINVKIEMPRPTFESTAEEADVVE